MKHRNTVKKSKNLNAKMVSTIIFLLLAFAFYLVQYFDRQLAADATSFNRQPDNLIFTKHAKCRMGCRFFTEKEVREILEEGKINNKKSRPQDKPCPSFALEGRTSDGQHARMVFATCDNKTMKVVTCIDLDTDYTCHCD